MATIKSATHLTVVQGGGNQLPSWKSPPSTVLGRSPFDPSRIMSFRVSETYVRKQLEANRRGPLCDLWWHVHGKVPPLPGASRYAHIDVKLAGSFRDAHACFRGLKRPAGEDEHGFDFAAFVTKPQLGFKYAPSMSCLIEPLELPSDLVFVTYVRLDFPEGRGHPKDAKRSPATEGVLTHWQLVECDPNEPNMPVDYKTRFRRQLW